MGELIRKRLEQTKSFENLAQEAMLNLMIAAGHLNEWNDKVCTEHGITRSQYNVLRILRGVYPGGHPRQEITRRMVDRSPDVTRLIDRLEKAGFVERDRTDQDRRLSIARITQRGLELLEQIAPDFDRLYAHLTCTLDARDMQELSRICEKIYGGTGFSLKRRANGGDAPDEGALEMTG